MEDEQFSEDKFSKPSFDGRVHYFEVVKIYMQNIAIASLSGNYVAWFRLLRGLFALLKAFIEPKKSEILNKEILTLKGSLLQIKTVNNQNKSTMIEKIDDKLQNLTEDIYSYAKHLFLPTSEDDKTLDDDFIKGLGE